jgi:3D (Asp-Asp-Asp) domain-containing protein
MPITVAVDGQLRRITTMARTSRQVLAQAGVSLGPADRVFPSPAISLWSGARVRVVRIEREFTTTRIPLPMPAVTRRDPTLPRGMVRTDPGRVGVKVQRFLTTFADGRLVSTTYLSQEVVRHGIPSVTRVGTRVLVASRGQFAGKEYMMLVATAYSPHCCRGVDSATALGLRAGYGVVAVDPRVIPLRSRLYIEGYGYAIAGDTGGAIKGLRIDLGMDTLRAARQFGRRGVRVYILEKGKPKRRA